MMMPVRWAVGCDRQELPRNWAIGMLGRRRWWRWLFGVALLAAVEGVSVLALTVAMPGSAQAQWSDRRYQFMRRQYQHRQSSGGFFGDLFGTSPSVPDRQPQWQYQQRQEQRRHVDYSRAPSPRKKEEQPDPNKPITSIMVMGGSMADWLAYGLEDAFSDSPNVDIVRKDKPNSGLFRYQPKSDLDWWHVARDELAQQPANYVVMMLGVRDRQNIREKDVENDAQDDKKPDDKKDGKDTAKNDAGKDKPKPKRTNGIIAFRSDEWAKVYSRRIDKTIAALKSRGVPVFWVGLPAIRGARSTADAVYLNNLFRARAERAGVVYIDVWDGFVDDGGKYSSYGPDYEGQTRQLRSADGVFFTKYGARKLAHYVEREIRRYMNNRVTTLTLPTGPVPMSPTENRSLVRPLAGPVLPLTAPTSDSDVLLGASGVGLGREDAVAASVLVNGNALNAPPGRSDDFRWPPDDASYGKAPTPPTAAKPAKPGSAATAPAVPAAVAAAPVAAGASAAAASAKALQPSPPPAAAANANAAAPIAGAPPAEPQSPPQAKQAAGPKPSATENAQAVARKRAAERAQAAARKRAEEQAQAEAIRRAQEQARADARRATQERTVRRDVPRPPGMVGPDSRRQAVRQRPPQPAPQRDDGGLFGSGGPFGWIGR